MGTWTGRVGEDAGGGRAREEGKGGENGCVSTPV
jgi:hypothetical protein